VQRSGGASEVMSLNDLVKILIVKFLYRFLNGVLSVIRSILFPRGLPKNPRRILIYRIGQIGDTICAIPAMIAVREHFPKAHITLLTSPVGRDMPGAKELLQGADFLDEMIIYYHNEIESWQGVLALVKKLREGRYEFFIELPNELGTFKRFLRDMVFAKVIGCKYAFGFRVATLRIFLKAQARHLRFKKEVERLLDVLGEEGIPTSKVSFRLPIKPEDKEFVDRLFEEHGVKGDLCIAINPGAKRPSNRWPKERFAEVGKALRERYGARIWITGGPADVELANWIAEEIGDSAIPVAGKTSLLQSAELLRRCELLITNDTGPMHLAEAVGTPIVAIISPWQLPGRWYPYGERNIILRGSASCELCYKFDCSLTKCIESISVEDVISACERVLKNLIPCAGLAAS